MLSDTARTYVAAPDELRERIILITGAGDGIGRAAAMACAIFIRRNRAITRDIITVSGFSRAQLSFPMTIVRALPAASIRIISSGSSGEDHIERH